MTTAAESNPAVESANLGPASVTVAASPESGAASASAASAEPVAAPADSAPAVSAAPAEPAAPAAAKTPDGQAQPMEYDQILSSFYGEGFVNTLILLHVDTTKVDEIANTIAAKPFVEDVFLVTGDHDLVVKASFENYAQFKDFLIHSVASLEGVNDTRTMMVVTTYKHRGELQ